MRFGSKPPIAHLLHRLIAVGGIALVLGLGVLSVSPALHEKLHAGTIGDGDHCVVAEFASGVSLGVDPVAVPVPPAEFELVRVASAEPVLLVGPRYLRQPERGPPTLG